MLMFAQFTSANSYADISTDFFVILVVFAPSTIAVELATQTI